MKNRLLSGIKPTGALHIGNYFGALQQFISLQNEYDSYIFIADYHALNLIQDKNTLNERTREIAASYLACGLNPENAVLFKQSAVPEHTELSVIFNAITTMPYLMRAHAFKDAEAKNKEITVGTFTYPLLMASDILLYSPKVVPVGQDQKQHIEIARDTAEKFNRTFSEVFSLPEALIVESTKIIPGIDGQKMSKSYNNIIPLFGSDEEITKASMSVITNSNPKGTPNDSSDTLFSLVSLFSEQNEMDSLKQKYESGELGYKETKELLAAKIIDYISPMREAYNTYVNNPTEIDTILKSGAERAREVANKKLLEAKQAIGVA